jgi:hypothetical protein
MKILFAEKWVSLDAKGNIAGLCTGYPPQELAKNQIPLTDDEYNLLKLFSGSLIRIRKTVRGIEKKIGLKK